MHVNITQFLYGLQVVFLRLLDAMKIPVVVMLAISSGYTTYQGMQEFVHFAIAGTITVAMQITIIISSYGLAGIRLRAHPMRWLTLTFILAFSLSISMYFTYRTFYRTFHTPKLQTEGYARLDHELAEYKTRFYTAKSEVIKEKRDKLELLIERLNMEKARYRPNQWPPTVRQLQFQVNTYNFSLKRLEEQFGGLEGQLKQFLERDWNMGCLKNEDGYNRCNGKLAAINNNIDSRFTNLNRRPITAPVFPDWKTLNSVQDPSTEMGLLPLFLAIAIDLFTVLFSYWLHTLPEANIEDEDLFFLYENICAFRSHAINSENHLETYLFRLPDEEFTNYNDTPRLLAAAILLEKGYLRRVDKTHFEFTPQLGDTILRRERKRKATGSGDLSKLLEIAQKVYGRRWKEELERHIGSALALK